MVETKVHYPTDSNLLFDATRKAIELTAKLYDELELPGWRQYKSLIGKCKSKLRAVQNIRHSTSKDEEKKARRAQELKACYSDFVDYCGKQVSKITETINQLNLLPPECSTKEIEMFIEYAHLFQDQIRRRVLAGEKIPHNEKVLSIFEPHTEWIVKGKAGINQELGLRVCVVTDADGFTLHHKVMQKQTDPEIAVEIIRETKERFPSIASCSFDKGFWSTENKKRLDCLLKNPALRKRGRLSQNEREQQQSVEFIEAQKGHSAVESAINAHENHGLDKCPDKGFYGFKRYVSLAVLARNLQHLGALLIKKEKLSQKHSAAIKRGLRRRSVA